MLASIQTYHRCAVLSSTKILKERMIILADGQIKVTGTQSRTVYFEGSLKKAHATTLLPVEIV